MGVLSGGKGGAAGVEPLVWLSTSLSEATEMMRSHYLGLGPLRFLLVLGKILHQWASLNVVVFSPFPTQRGEPGFS